MWPCGQAITETDHRAGHEDYIEYPARGGKPPTAAGHEDFLSDLLWPQEFSSVSVSIDPNDSRNAIDNWVDAGIDP